MQTLELDLPTARWALPLLEPMRYKGARGGRAAGRSHFFAELAVERMVTEPNLRVVCIREVQRSLKFSAKSLVELKIAAMGVGHLFDIKTTEIRRLGGTGVMIFEGMQDHTADSIKSLENFGVAWLEEAHSISKRSLSLLLPTIRAEGSEIWFSWNPDLPTDPVDVFFADDPKGSVCVHATYKDNPFLPDVMRIEAERMKVADPNEYEHVWAGGYFLGGAGRVYSNFVNRPYPIGNIHEGVSDTAGSHEIYVGMDFNVNPMSAVVAVKVARECHVIDSIALDTSNTEEMAQELRTRYPNRRIIICPDPAGRARKTSAPVGQTDFTILEAAGFEVRSPKAAPPVVDRVNNTQAALCAADRNDQGERTELRCVLIHPRCKSLVRGLSGLIYKEGTSQPDKRNGYDHPCDALGYLLWQEFNTLVPVRRPVVRTLRI